ncbi:MAG: twin-arginine translocation pathway signal protein [Hyphomicrobiales bacterium]|nr:twin-arginine translocation pathway signal protein [Hyphomicrobiales bacterium]
MAYDRRKVLGIIGGGSILAAAAGTGVFLSTRTPTKALAPWQLAGQYQEPRRKALSYAILSPNPHNRQPWQVDLSQKDKIILYVDTNRLLPHTDPFNRQITIGLGCFLELLRMAAAEDGYRLNVEPFPDGFDAAKLDNRPVADITMIRDANVKKDPLFAHVLNRRSLKEPFDLTRAIPDNVLKELEEVVQDGVRVGTSNVAKQVDEMRLLTHEAMAIEIETPRTYKESVDLFRIGKSEINANPDGIDFSGPLFGSLALLGLFSRDVALDVNSSAYQQGIGAVMENVDTAMGYIWLKTTTNARIDQLNAGRDWLRVNLATTALGVGLHPISQALQEYEEMNSHYDKIHKMLDAEGETVQMLGRLGYAQDVAPSPRWPLDAKITKA